MGLARVLESVNLKNVMDCWENTFSSRMGAMFDLIGAETRGNTVVGTET